MFSTDGGAEVLSLRLAVEPGRAVVGPAGVALYRVLTVKHTGEKVFVAVDGGMSDNPRPALYGVRYAPRLVGRPAVIGVHEGTARTLVRRETLEDFRSRDIGG